MSTNWRLAATRASAAWAAWGDALGFITELTDASGLRHRAGLDTVTHPVAWRRRVGGQMGVQAQLPPGAYSDDTQLRLATSRAIRGDGDFDVDSFARVELVAWQAYHLGAGRGSKAAAAGMSRTDATWNQNTFSTKAIRYIDVGGNGAAMRIQPHVWASPTLEDPAPLLNRVMRDAVCTHGHPVGLVGAALHALSLQQTMAEDRIPRPAQWVHLANALRTLPSVFASDDELGGLWMSAWEAAAQGSFLDALDQAIHEAEKLLGDASAALASKHPDAAARYREVLAAVGGFAPATRGSGTGTAIAALALAASADDPVQALRLAVNTLDTDTDTIATMAGALLGAVVADRPPTPPQDHRYIDYEASRLHAVAMGRGQEQPTYRYPDLLTWSPPRSALDLVGLTDDGELALAGHGTLTPSSDPVRSPGSRTPTVYQWMILPTGQHVHLRFRSEPRKLASGLLPARAVSSPPGEAPKAPTTAPMMSGREQVALPLPVAHPTLSVDEALRSALSRDFAPDAVGEALLGVISSDPAAAVERAAAFAAAVARELGRRSHQ